MTDSISPPPQEDPSPAPKQADKMVLIPEMALKALNDTFLLRIAVSINTIEKYDGILAKIHKQNLGLNELTSEIIIEKELLRKQYKQDRKTLTDAMNSVKRPEATEGQNWEQPKKDKIEEEEDIDRNQIPETTTE